MKRLGTPLRLLTGRARLAEALAGASEPGELRARALTAAGELAAWSGDLVGARSLIGEAVSIWRELGHEREIALALHELGWGYFYAGDDPAARHCMEESLALQQSVGEPYLVNRARIGLLQVLVSLGELESVEPLAREALTLAQQLGAVRSEHFAHHFLADCRLIRGDFVCAEESYRRALEVVVELGDRSETAVEIQGLTMSAAGRSRPRRALRLAGAAAAEFDALGIDLSGIRFWSALLERYLGQARDELGAEAADVAWQEGRRMAFHRAIEEALAPTSGASRAARSGGAARFSERGTTPDLGPEIRLREPPGTGSDSGSRDSWFDSRRANQAKSNGR